MTGSSDRTVHGSPDYATVAYEAKTGTMRWVTRYGNLRPRDGATSIVASPDGNSVVVTGYSGHSTSFGRPDYATVTYDAMSGGQRWEARYNGTGKGDDIATSMAIAPDGSSVFVTGRSEGATSAFDYATVAYDMDAGAKRWVATYDGPAIGDDAAASVAVSPDGTKVFVTGSSTGVGTLKDYATIAYSESVK